MKSRKTLAIVTIVLAALLATGLIGFQVVQTISKVPVLVLSTNVTKGEEITQDKVTTVEMNKADVRDTYITDASKIFYTGAPAQFATIDMMADDIISTKKISTSATATDNQFLSIPSGKQALSFSVNAGASSLSNKLRTGDIIRLYTVENGQTKNFESLQFVRIASITSSDYQDVNANQKSDQPVVYSTITVIVDSKQASDIISIEKGSGVYITLISRGDETLANELLDRQDQALVGMQ